MKDLALKNILILFSITLVLISFSCSDTNSVNSPLQSENSIQSDRFSDCQFYITKIIDGSVGGEISVDTVLMNLQGNFVRVEALLQFDPLSFEGVREIRIIPNVNNGYVQFFPHMKFNAQVKLDLLLSGINLSKLGFDSTCKVDFVYISDDGVIQYILKDEVKIKWDTQEIKVKKAYLPHFSRYSFIKKSL